MRRVAACPGTSASEAEAELRALRPKNTELEKIIEILEAPTSFFERECDPPCKMICRVIAEHRDRFGVVPI